MSRKYAVVHLPPPVHARAKSYCEATGDSLSRLVTALLKQKLMTQERRRIKEQASKEKLDELLSRPPFWKAKT